MKSVLQTESMRNKNGEELTTVTNMENYFVLRIA